MHTKPHQKHAFLTKPDLGNFARNEWSILGTPCGVIKKFSFELIKILSTRWKVGYVDADHKHADDEKGQPNTALGKGAAMEYTDKINFHRFDSRAGLDKFQYRSQFNEMDAVLVNGNHFKAKQQVVVIDRRKAESLQRKQDRLTDVRLFLLQEDEVDIYPFLKEHIADWESIPVLHISEMEKVASFFKKELKSSIPALNGLVLAGGRSQRMGTDKGLMEFHGKPQREYLAEVLQGLDLPTFLSTRPGQEVDSEWPVLKDSFLELGPFGAILSAFRQDPEKAWLVVACDLPLLDREALQFLIDNRNPSQIATAFHNPETNFPDPLITIWEPKSYLVLLQFLTQGFSCPRKVLINSDIEILQAPDGRILKNVNRPEDVAEIRAILDN